MKTVFKALLCSVLINLAGFLVNYVSFFTMEKLPLSIRMYGGEWTGHLGFGLLMNEIYPLSPQGSGGVVRSLEFAPGSLAATLVLFFVVALVVLMVRRKK